MYILSVYCIDRGSYGQFCFATNNVELILSERVLCMTKTLHWIIVQHSRTVFSDEME